MHKQYIFWLDTETMKLLDELAIHWKDHPDVKVYLGKASRSSTARLAIHKIHAIEGLNASNTDTEK